MAIIHPTKYYCTVCHIHKSIYTYIYIIYNYIIAIYNNNTYSAGMKERCRDGCRTSLLIAGVVLVPAIFHTLLPPCHPYITIHFMEMIFFTCTKMDCTLVLSLQRYHCLPHSRLACKNVLHHSRAMVFVQFDVNNQVWSTMNITCTLQMPTNLHTALSMYKEFQAFRRFW